MIFKIILFFICFNYIYGVSVKTNSGVVKGLTLEIFNQSIDQYLGNPYSEPPIGSLRFAKPKPIGYQNVTIDGTKPKKACIQMFSDKTFGPQSEDCLVLNIWTKNETQLKPVMFWIYGGAFSVGTINQPIYNGSVLATQEVVIVTVKYRVGPLGFLYGGEESAPGNVGLFDQLLALKWVRENIHLFGGDKNEITFFGESAGSVSGSIHILSPLSKGLFKRVIMESGAMQFNRERVPVNTDEALLKAKQLAKNMNCTDDKHWLDCLRKVDAKNFVFGKYETTFPVIGTEILPIPAVKAFKELKFNRDLEIMAGITRDEGSALTDLISDKTTFNTKENFIDFVKSANKMFHNMNVENITEFYFKDVNTSDSNAIKWKVYDFYGDIFMKCPTFTFGKLGVN